MAFGFGVMTTGWFRTGIAFFYFGAWWRDHVTGRQFFKGLAPHWARLIVIGYIVLLAVFSWQLIFLPAALELHADSGQYGAGSVINGIPWESDYSEMALTVENLTDNDDLDSDATITT